MARSPFARKLTAAERRDEPLSPRVKLACRLYASGAAKTKREASELAGLSATTLTLLRHEPKVNDLVRRVDEEIQSGTVNMSEVIRALGRKAVVTIADIMTTDGVKDDIRLKAAQDLADRSPETSKTLKVQAESSLSISDEAAELIRAAMLESARSRLNFAEAANGNFITATDEATRSGLELVKDSVSALPSGEDNAPG